MASLRDDDMLKAKRVREILKACEKILEFAKSFRAPMPQLEELATTVMDTSAKVEGKGLKSSLGKLDALFSSLRETTAEGDVKMDEDEAEERDVPDEDNSGKGKKDKKKKKKKKRGKK